MNGPEHYVEAERLVDAYQASLDELDPDLSDAELRAQIEQGTNLAQLALAAAQVHATLALAAATALAQGRNLGTVVERWQGVAQ